MYLSRSGYSKKRKDDEIKQKALVQEIHKLKQKLQKKRYYKQVDKIVKSFREDKTSIDDVTYEKIAEMKVMIAELVRDANKKENGQINANKILKTVKILDAMTNTLLKARILEDKPTEKIDEAVNVSLADKLLFQYDKDINEIDDKDSDDEIQ